MLESTKNFTLAFDNMKSKGVPYVNELVKYGGASNDDDWKMVSTFLPFLRILYEAIMKLSDSR